MIPFWFAIICINHYSYNNISKHLNKRVINYYQYNYNDNKEKTAKKLLKAKSKKPLLIAKIRGLDKNLG